MIDRGPDKDRRWYKVFWTLYGIFLVLAIANSLVHGTTRFGLGDLLGPACPAGILTAIWWASWGRKRTRPSADVPLETQFPQPPRLRIRQQPEAPPSSPQFATEDDEAQHWLANLRDGDDAQKIAARAGLAAIFERREMYAEAIELVSRNIQAGERTSANHHWLARLRARQ